MSQWIGVKKRLPVKDGKYLVRIKGLGKQEIICSFNHGKWEVDNVTKWAEWEG